MASPFLHPGSHFSPARLLASLIIRPHWVLIQLGAFVVEATPLPYLSHQSTSSILAMAVDVAHKIIHPLAQLLIIVK